ncbi:MAG: ATP-binding cassette domain-containing protein [Bacteroidetes bacterium]|nr:ATP-binding cassette domain-containing protein [Bacteroidota bacterium]MBS1740899.1 ATP-binding cassette domain-containing protein [Bacteroidota bacterium]
MLWTVGLPVLKFYKPTSGEIMLGKQMLCDLSPEWWRNQCGVVMQDGFIFNDTIAGNIAMGDAPPNHERLKQAVEVANIRSFIESLPMTYLTQIGSGGIGISAGQRQRLLIARAVYKNPEYLFFDEATSALDANNEKEISNNLAAFFARKTVVVIAHRLSTVKHADQIVVLEEGRVLEIGNHASLLSAKGRYYELVKNQLEISA